MSEVHLRAAPAACHNTGKQRRSSQTQGVERAALELDRVSVTRHKTRLLFLSGPDERRFPSLRTRARTSGRVYMHACVRATHPRPPSSRGKHHSSPLRGPEVRVWRADQKVMRCGKRRRRSRTRYTIHNPHGCTM